MSTPLSLHQVRPQDWDAVRQVTLQMLADSPHAFGEPLASAAARSPQEWQQQARQLADPAQGCAYLAADSQGVCGFIRLDTVVPQFPPDSALAAQLWVAPRQRGTGLGRRLMEAISRRAVGQGIERIYLGVLATNPEAVKFYAHLGYADTGRREETSEQAPRQIIIMSRRLQPECR